MATTPARPTTVTGSSLGGYDFVANPDLGWRDANVFWRPEVAADIVSFAPSPLRFGVGPTIEDLRRIANVERAGNDGLHFLCDDGVQIWLAVALPPDQALAAVLTFDGRTDQRARAAVNVARRLSGLRPVPVDTLSRPALRRYAHRLRALDGTRAGASSRQIAVALFGAANVPGGTAWKSSDIRSRTFRLLADARALSNGGHLNLLR